MNVTPIVLQARMMQSAITFWQSMFVMQKQWFEAVTGSSFAPTAPATAETAKDAAPQKPAPILRRRTAGA